MEAQEPLLDEVFRFARAPQHAVGDREGAGPQLLVELLRRHG